MACSHHTQHNVGALNHGDLVRTLLLPSESHLRDQFLIRVKWRAAQNPSLSFLVRPPRLQLFSIFPTISILQLFQYIQLFQYFQLFQHFQLFPACVPITYTRTPLDGQTVDRGVKFQNCRRIFPLPKIKLFPSHRTHTVGLIAADIIAKKCLRSRSGHGLVRRGLRCM